MFTTITPAKLEAYLTSIDLSSLSDQQKKIKVDSIEKFLNWAVNKGHLTDLEFNQLGDVIANHKKYARHVDHNEGLNPIGPHYVTNLSIKDLFKQKKYLVLALLLILSFAFIRLPNNQVAKVYAAPTTSNVLSFKGKITDKLGNPVIDKTDVTFRVYPSVSSSTPIYTGACTGMSAITPDVDGTVNVQIGKDCGMKAIPASIFTSYQSLYLGITVGNDPEMQPRKQLANVNFSSNSNTLQGLPAGNSTSTVPYINEQGDLLIDAPQASITAVSKSSNFSINSANVLNLRADNDINISSIKDGSIRFATNGEKKESLIIGTNGNVGVNSPNPALFTLQVGGNVGPNLTGVYNIGSFDNQWNAVYSNKFYQNGYEVCDMSSNCSSISGWSSLAAPTDNTSIDMGSYTTTFTYGSSTSSNNLFNITDTAYNSGTGYLFNLSTSPGSQLNPFHVNTAGVESLMVAQNGNVGIGTTNPAGARLRVQQDGEKDYTNYAGYFSNSTQNVKTDGIDKYGLYVSSNGDFSGGSAGQTNNYGIYIAKTTGADVNYDIYAASGAYLSTGGTWTNASARDLKENFTPVDPQDILNKISQLNLTTWNYKTENESIKHLGPIAEDFYSLFHLGNSNKSISTIDPAGVALVGVQALNNKITQLEKNSFTSVDNEGNVQLISNNQVYTYNGIVDPTVDDAQYSILYQNHLVDSIQAIGQVISSKIKTGFIESENAVIKNAAYINDLTAKQLHISDKVTSPVVETDQVQTTKVVPQEKDLTIDLNKTASSEASTDKGDVAKVIINGLGNKAVTTIDAQGNIVTDGNITAKTASISGSLISDNVQTHTASISGELTADTIKSKSIDQINEQITNNNSSISSITSQVNDVQKLLSQIKNTSPTDNLPHDTTVGDISTSGSPTFENVSVDNTATLYKATVVDSLFVGNLIERTNSLLSLNADFNISSLGTVSFFENAVTIAKDGTLTATGQINALAGVNTNTIRSLNNTDNVNVVLGANANSTTSFDIQNDQQKTVASITNDGTASFKELSLNKYTPPAGATVIAAEDNLVRNGQNSPAIETTVQTAGIGTIPARSNEVIIYNDKVKDTSLIYLTPTSPTDGTGLTIVEKEPCSQAVSSCKPYFKVGVDKQTSAALNFNWLMIN